MKCQICGHEFRTTVRSCPRCGAPVVVQPAPAADPGQSAAPDWLAGDGWSDSPVDERTVMRRAVPADRPVEEQRPVHDAYAPAFGVAQPEHAVAAPAEPFLSAARWDPFGPSAVVAPESAYQPQPIYQPQPTYPPDAPGVFGAPLAGAVMASAGSRLGAVMIDGLIFTVGFLVLQVAVMALAPALVGDGTDSVQAIYAFMLILYLPQLLLAVMYPIYYSVYNGRGQTLGKKALNLQVIDVNTGGPIGSGRAFLRYLVSGLMGLPFGLGYLSIFADDRGRGWHDKAANSLVVKVGTEPTYR